MLGRKVLSIELILQAIVVASIKISVKSIAETFISDYNRKNDKLRKMQLSLRWPRMAQ